MRETNNHVINAAEYHPCTFSQSRCTALRIVAKTCTCTSWWKTNRERGNHGCVAGAHVTFFSTQRLTLFLIVAAHAPVDSYLGKHACSWLPSYWLKGNLCVKTTKRVLHVARSNWNTVVPRIVVTYIALKVHQTVYPVLYTWRQILPTRSADLLLHIFYLRIVTFRNRTALLLWVKH